MQITKQKICEIKNLYASIENIQIIKGINLTINQGEIHAIMGLNGSGKSTLSKVLIGHHAYKVNKGEIKFKNQNIVNINPEIRSRLGLFLAFQYPTEMAGVLNNYFLRSSYNGNQKNLNLPEFDSIEFLQMITLNMQFLQMNERFLNRNVNEGFSGGEKKRNEILQLAITDSQIAILDETDSGLDIDALKIVATGINKLINEKKSIIVITHYQRLLDYIQPDFVHVVENGRIIETGTKKLATKLENQGYTWLIE